MGVLPVARCSASPARWRIPTCPPTMTWVLERLPEKTDPSLRDVKRLRTALAATRTILLSPPARTARDRSGARNGRSAFSRPGAGGAGAVVERCRPAARGAAPARDPEAEHPRFHRRALRSRSADLVAPNRRPGPADASDRAHGVKDATARRVPTARASRARAPLVRRLRRRAGEPVRRSRERLSLARGALARRPPMPGSPRMGADFIGRDRPATRRPDAAETHFRAALALDRAIRICSAPTPTSCSIAIARSRSCRSSRTTAATIVCCCALRSPKRGCRSARYFEAHRAELEDRFEAARRRGDSLHRREEARYTLELAGDAPARSGSPGTTGGAERERGPAHPRRGGACRARCGNAREASDWIAAQARRCSDRALRR